VFDAREDVLDFDFGFGSYFSYLDFQVFSETL